VDILGFVFGIVALGVASTAQAQIGAMKKEVETIRTSLQNKSE
jgi:hypothetical protein